MPDNPKAPQCPSQDAQPTDPSIPPPLLAALSAAAISLLAFLLSRRRRTTPTPTVTATRTKPTSPTLPALAALARLWLEQDPDPSTRATVQSWLRSAALPTTSPQTLHNIAARLDPTARVPFGTAGLRAPVGVGHDRLNQLTILRTTQGLLTHARVALSEETLARGVLIGHDAREHSRLFALTAAAVLRAAGLNVHLLPAHVPTPLVAFGVLRASHALALCVTASHNPPADNGLKVYWTDGMLVRPARAAAIETAIRANRAPWRSYEISEPPCVPDALSDLQASYISQISTALRRAPRDVNARAQPAVYTACHGVGHGAVRAAFDAWGLPEPIPVPEQTEPDPAFPTLPYPNPEERGALSLALRTAREHGVRLVLANDPDADRLGVAEVDMDGKARIFTGDEIATLFADYLTADFAERDLSACAMVASTVSSKFLASMAARRGFAFHESLTGFKWLSKTAVDLEAEGKTVLLTYEEALGYNVTRNIVRDKDGISAAAMFAELAAAHYTAGGTLVSRLRELQIECGLHLSRNGYLRTSAASPSAREIFDAARKRGLPRNFGDAVVRSVRDLTQGLDSAESDGKAVLPADATSQFLTFRCGVTSDPGDECPLIIHVRASGTEPKIKFYAELRCSTEQAKDGIGEAFLATAVQDAIDQLLQPAENKLIPQPAT